MTARAVLSAALLCAPALSLPHTHAKALEPFTSSATLADKQMCSCGCACPCDTCDFAGPDVGAPYANTEPRVGINVKFSYADAALFPLPPAYCAGLAAAVDRHNKWFDGDATAPEIPKIVTDSPQKYAASDQQSGERAFIESIIPDLCANPDQSDDEFTENLLGKLDEARTHINRHTHAAFYIKEMCGNADEPCLNTTDYITNLPQSTGKVHGYTQQGLCFQHVLEHEKYNVAEGFDFVNISMTILKAGASFCKDPQLTETVAQMRDQLETSMAYHRSNDLFKQLSNGHMQNYCTGAELDLSYDETYAAASENIDASVMATPNCSFAAETAAKMPWMTSNPPAAIDLIHVFEMNTKITMAVAAEAVQDVLTKEEGCMDPDTGKIDDVESAAILGALNAVNLPQAIYEDMQDNHGLKAGQKFFNPSGSILSGQFMVPSVYHKLAFGCIPQVGVNSSLDRSLARTSGLYNKSTGLVSDKDIKLFGKLPNGGSSTQIATCIAEDGTTMVPLNSGESPIFDIGPSATRCAGEACKTAATATINYQSFLRYITQLRWDAILVGSGGYSRGGGDFYSQDTWTFQRSCDALRNIVTGLTSAQEQLGHILKELKESSPQLDALCVAPPRDFITDEALSVLPTDRAVKNREIWAKGTVSPPGCLPPVAYLPPIY